MIFPSGSSMTLGVSAPGFHTLGPASEDSKLQNHYKKGVFTRSLWTFSQFRGKLIATTDEKDLYKPITKLNSMVRGSS